MSDARDGAPGSGAPDGREVDAGGGGGAPGAGRLSSALLAYIGDAVFGLFVRTLILDRLCLTPGPAAPSVEALHREVERVVAAEGQARLLGALWSSLTPAEQDVVRRARNAKLRRRPRGSNYRAYRRSTGLEALVGYLYLDGQTDRLVELLRLGLELEDRGGS